MKQPFQFDATGRRILRVLQTDAGVSNQELADKVGSSAASCWRRVRAMQAAGILGPIVRKVDPAAIGRGLDAFCQVRLKEQTREARASFEQFIDQQDDVVECYAVSGEWDYVLHVLAADVGDYERVLMRAILEHASIAASSTVFALRRVKHSAAIPV